MVRICTWGGCSAGRNATLKELDTGKRRIGGGYGGSRRFLGDGCLLFISMIIFLRKGGKGGHAGKKIDLCRD